MRNQESEHKIVHLRR